MIENASSKIPVAPSDPQVLPEVDIPPSLSDQRGTRSFKKPAEGTVSDADNAEGDADAVEVLSTANFILSDARSSTASSDITDAVQAKSSVQERPKQAKRRSKAPQIAVKEMSKRIVAKALEKVSVQVGSAENESTIRTKSGKRDSIKLHRTEKSRVVQLGDEKIIVLNKSLTKEEVKSETERRIVEEIINYAEQFGLHDIYNPFFDTLKGNGFDDLIPYFGEYAFPKSMSTQTTELFQANDQSDRLEELRRRLELIKSTDLA